MKVLAFDPGFERLGVAVIEKIARKETLLHSECVRTSATLPFSKRLAELGAAAEALIARYEPDAIALEEVYFVKNEKTALKIAEVRGMLVYVTTSRAIPLHQYTPLQVKVAITGYGMSDKKAVAAMVERLIELPRLPGTKRLDDEIDAIAVGLTCLASVR
jgi:crossover junction endodeoxyribonuclease RuvC